MTQGSTKPGHPGVRSWGEGELLQAVAYFHLSLHHMFSTLHHMFSTLHHMFSALYHMEICFGHGGPASVPRESLSAGYDTHMPILYWLTLWPP